MELHDVLLIASNGDVRVGQPRLEGARVIAEVVEHGRGPKVIVFKYKAKTRYRRRRGHRQGYTRLAVRQILTAEGPLKGKEKPKRRRVAKAETKTQAKSARRSRSRKQKPEAEMAETAAATVEAPGAEAKPTRRTGARKAPAEQPEANPPRRTRVRKPAAKGAAEKTEEETPESGE